MALKQDNQFSFSGHSVAAAGYFKTPIVIPSNPIQYLVLQELKAQYPYAVD